MADNGIEAGRHYANRLRKNGLSDAQIRQTLQRAGWSDADVDAVLSTHDDDAKWHVQAPDGTPYGPYTQADLKNAVNTREIDLQWDAVDESGTVITVNEALRTAAPTGPAGQNGPQTAESPPANTSAPSMLSDRLRGTEQWVREIAAKLPNWVLNALLYATVMALFAAVVLMFSMFGSRQSVARLKLKLATIDENMMTIQFEVLEAGRGTLEGVARCIDNGDWPGARSCVRIYNDRKADWTREWVELKRRRTEVINKLRDAEATGWRSLNRVDQQFFDFAGNEIEDLEHVCTETAAIANRNMDNFDRQRQARKVLTLLKRYNARHQGVTAKLHSLQRQRKAAARELLDGHTSKGP